MSEMINHNSQFRVLFEMQSFPKDVITLIATHVDDILSFKRVCRLFHSAVSGGVVWKYKCALLEKKIPVGDRKVLKDSYLRYIALQKKLIEQERQEELESITKQITLLKDRSSVLRDQMRHKEFPIELRTKAFLYKASPSWNVKRLPHVHRVKMTTDEFDEMFPDEDCFESDIDIPTDSYYNLNLQMFDIIILESEDFDVPMFIYYDVVVGKLRGKSILYAHGDILLRVIPSVGHELTKKFSLWSGLSELYDIDIWGYVEDNGKIHGKGI